MDKAGAYAIQGLASRFIERIDGSYTQRGRFASRLVYRMLEPCFDRAVMGRGVMTKLRDVIRTARRRGTASGGIADAAALYEAVDRNRAHLRPWFAWVEATHGEGDILRHLEERERENASRASFAAHIWVEDIGAISLHTFHLQHHRHRVLAQCGIQKAGDHDRVLPGHGL